MKSHEIFVGIILDYCKQLEIENAKLKKQIKKLKRKADNEKENTHRNSQRHT